MAVLTNTEREAVRAKLVDELSASYTPTTLLKADFRDAANAIDDWIEANLASFNMAIPEPARSGLAAKQKLRLFLFIVNKRWEVG